MSTVFIVHGIGGSPEENWFPWLKTELERSGHIISIPQFPNADRPLLEEWMEHFKRYLPSINEHTILIGHSLGAAFLLRLLETIDTPVKATFLIAPVSGRKMSREYEPLMTSFTNEPFDVETIRRNAGSVTILNSDNDPFIPLASAKRLAESLQATITVIAGGGHFNASAGYDEFPELLKVISEM
ncbi:MAG: alpha/beta hydrolase [Candidatus Peribacteraceae bacterium]|nr:alpha/beta hydrolase [Candidatus Peribacteraceae bacterium]